MSKGGFFNLPNPLEPVFADIRNKWRWFFALGVVLIALGATASAYAFYTTVASVFVVGWIMLFAGISLGLFSFLIGRWSGFLLSLSAGILTAFTGIMLLHAPLSGAAALTLVIASFLFVTGMFRAIASAALRFPNWGWSAFSGIVGILLGSMLFANWPGVAAWFIGFYVGIDMMTHGFAWCMFLLSVREFAKSFIPEAARDRVA
jgi:uncharacterized membrane protein HdeD (DUF308 family)